MNYNYYNPYPAAVPGYYQNPVNNVQPQPQPQPQQAQNELMAILIKDDNAVQNYPVANGNSVILMNYDSGKFWIKSMSNIGTPTITEHEFKPLNTDQNNQTNNLVSRDEFDKLSKSVSEMQEIVNQLK